MYNSLDNSFIKSNVITLNKGDTLLLTLSEGTTVDEAKSLCEIFQKAFPDNHIIVNFCSFVKSIDIFHSVKEEKEEDDISW